MTANWSDLRPRVLSAVVMVAVGAGAIWAGGLVFEVLVIVACSAMLWELGRMTAPGKGLAVLAPVALALAVFNTGLPDWLRIGAFVAAVLAVSWQAQGQFRVPAGIYALIILTAGVSLIVLRSDPGVAAILWLVSVVVASDIAGYFAGRALGGPKFWPAISPKKTWSGTVAGWAGAALVGLGFLLAGQGGWALVILSPLVAFAGQMGDIAESWFKRRAGIKDSSALIPGHGGFLDRFDALIFAAVVVGALSLVAPLAVGG